MKRLFIRLDAPYYMARNDYRACLHATRSEPEGSSHSGNIVCRGVAGGVTTLTPREVLSRAVGIKNISRFAATDFVQGGFLSFPIYEGRLTLKVYGVAFGSPPI